MYGMALGIIITHGQHVVLKLWLLDYLDICSKTTSQVRDIIPYSLLVIHCAIRSINYLSTFGHMHTCR